MAALRIVPLLAAAVLAAAIVRAALTADFLESFAVVLADPWGLVGIVDLYMALVLLAVVVWVLEPSRTVAVLVILASPFFGSIAPALWLALRLPAVARNRPLG